MTDRFYIWEDDERNGPYTEGQVERMLEDRIITFSHECEHAVSGKRVLLDELFEPYEETEEEEAADAGDDDGEWEYEDEEGEEAGGDEGEGEGETEWEYEDGEEDEAAADGDWEEEESEEWEEEEGEELLPGAILYSGHPTLFRYIGGFALAALGIAFGWWLGPRSIWFFIGGFGVAVLAIIAVLIDRSTRVYTVTPKRIELDWGLFARSSKEVRIEDIRTINVRKSGLLGILGVGTVEFSSTGDGIDVAFTDIWRAKKVKMLVRELQDETG